jgi:glutaminyl-peptide cyclotransferase
MKKLLYISLLISIAACKNNDKKATGAGTGILPSPTAPKSVGYSIVTTFPHDTSSYTQGLVIYKGDMYEGTGRDGFSKLMKVDLKTGKILEQAPLGTTQFGEGITIINDTIYQLTWRNKLAFSYTLKDFKKIKEFPLEHDGWGLTNNGKELIASDGGSNLYYYEPGTFKLLRTQSITDDGAPTYNINELEYIDGYIYANQYQQPYIFKIDASSGAIVAKIDLTDLWRRAQSINPQADVPNGIAFDPATKKIYITGKLWPELYEIQLSQ